MIELVAYEQKPAATNDTHGKQHVLDLSNPGAISLTYEVGRGDQVLGRFSPFSQTFRLPFSNINSAFFVNYFEVNVLPTAVNSAQVPRFNIHKKCYAEIRVDGVPIIRGSLQLKNVHNKTEEFEVAVFGMEANIFQDIKDKKLVDLFINGNVQDVDYDVALSANNISNSWTLSNDVTEGSVGNGVIIFPLADYGLAGEYNFLHYENNNIGTGGLAEDDFLQPYMFKPAIQVAHLFEKIINEAGYSLATNSFLTSDAWTKLYMTLANDRESVATRGALGLCVASDQAIIAQFTGTSPAGQTEAQYPLELNDDTGAGLSNNPPALFDVADNWSTSLFEFTAPATGTYYGELHINYSAFYYGNYGGQIGYSFTGPNGGAVIAAGNNGYVTASSANPNTDAPVLSFEIFLEAGQKAQASVYGRIFGSSGGQYIRVNGAGTYLTIYASQLTNGIASMPQNMPDMQQVDFVRDLCERFNLCMVTDPDDPQVLNIQPWQDYLDDGTTKDWTDRLDTSKQFTITSTDSIRKKFIHFEDAEDETWQNANFIAGNDYVLGRYKDEIGQDFTNGTLENSPEFAPYFVSPIPRINQTDMSDYPNVIIHKGYGVDTNGPISNAKPKLFYYNGLKAIDGDHYFKIGTTSFTSYPLCLPFYNNGDNIASDSPLLLWQWESIPSMSNPAFGSTPSSEGYFARYWQQFLTSIYSQEARLVDCFMMLSPDDIFNFSFNDEIRIENTVYRVLKISNYQPFADVPSKVQLLKKLDAFKAQNIAEPDEECLLQIVGFQQNGNVLFQDPITGTQSSGTEKCCNEAHYYWDGTNCLWNTGPGGGGNGINDGNNPNTAAFNGKSLVTNLGGVHAFKNKQAKNFNPIAGEVSIRGTNIVNNANSTQKNFVYYCTTYEATPAFASPSVKNDRTGALLLPPQSMARFVIRALSIQNDNYSATSGTGSFGSTSFNVYTFIAKNINGTITTSGAEQTDFAQADADAGSRSVTVAALKGTGITADQPLGVVIQCTGSANRVVTWHLDCSVTFIDIYSPTINQSSTLLLLENLGFILAENMSELQQE
ncbi:hypothetical protein [Acinetobacter sp.]|uniref:hypothetical protein n=1 Tax=Acinetobacter sp. TaxID=472 RepID=UPI000C0AD1C4|nr:hypothetical protein [Acinetobacter sp.]MAK30306.1 hypothetical protein [Acinetobacter sp.]